jgi:hypothetical protein
MATATATEAPEDPIVSVYPVPGELDTRDKGRLPPSPVRLSREDATKAVKTGAFSYDDPSQTAAAKAARQPALEAAKADIVSKAELGKMIAAAVADANKERDEKIAGLEKQLADQAAAAAATPPDKGK